MLILLLKQPDWVLQMNLKEMIIIFRKNDRVLDE